MFITDANGYPVAHTPRAVYKAVTETGACKAYKSEVDYVAHVVVQESTPLVEVTLAGVGSGYFSPEIGIGRFLELTA